MKKILSYILTLCMLSAVLLTPMSAYAENSGDGLEKTIADVGEYIYKTVPNPSYGYVGGEWTVFALARSGYNVSDEYYGNYYKSLEQYVKDRNGVLSDRKYTEYARVVIALTAIGKNPTDVGGYNLLLPLADYEKTVSQGINGAIWALTAFDCADYEIPAAEDVSNQATREKYVDYILSRETENGGWAFSGSDGADADLTAMAITALSPYKSRSDVSAAIEKGLNALSAVQTENGGFLSSGEENCESASQVLTALCEIGIPVEDERFVKNGNTVLDSVMSFYIPNEGFKHTSADTASNLMSTEQALYSLTAARRAINGEAALFDMSKAAQDKDSDKTFAAGLANKNADVKSTDVKYPERIFDDVKNHKNAAAIQALAERGIINGTTDTAFEPDATMTRAQFAVITVIGLGLPIKEDAPFTDVLKGAWYYDYINTAYAYGIVSGVSESEFNPNGTITNEEAAAMIARAAKLCGMNTDMDDDYARDTLAAFTDYIKVSKWAFSSVAFCSANQITDNDEIELKPQTAVTRAQVAQMMFNMLRKAELI